MERERKDPLETGHSRDSTSLAKTVERHTQNIIGLEEPLRFKGRKNGALFMSCIANPTTVRGKMERQKETDREREGDRQRERRRQTERERERERDKWKINRYPTHQRVNFVSHLFPILVGQ